MRVIDYSQIERRRQRQASHKRRVRRSVIFLAILVLLSGYGYLAYQRPLPPAEGVRVELKPAVHTKPNLVWPAYGQAAIGSPNYGVLDESGDQTPTPTASTAKIMTALAVLNQKPFKRTQGGPILTMTDEDVAAYTYYSTHDGSFVPVAAGEQLNEYQALEAMLLPSANNMAETLARWAFGSTDAYVQYANSLATELGMRHTHIADASGLFNLSRNLGGAIGIALIDTIVFSRGPEHADRLLDLIKADPAKAATALGLTLDEMPDPQDPTGLMGIMDVIQQASLTSAINEAWLVMGGITAVALIVLFVMGPIRVPASSSPDRTPP